MSDCPAPGHTEIVIDREAETVVLRTTYPEPLPPAPGACSCCGGQTGHTLTITPMDPSPPTSANEPTRR